MTCRPAFLPEFEEKYNNIEDTNFKKRVTEKIIMLCQHPLANKTYGLHGDLIGKRSFWVTKNYRIIYAYCRFCRQSNHTQHNNCKDCPILADETVVFFTLGPHEEVY